MLKVPIQTRFNDMDPMRRVNNSSYTAYLEIARVEFCNQNFVVKDLEDIPFVLARLEMDLLASVLPGMEIFVKVWVSKIGTTSWEFSYEICEKNSERVFVKAKSVQVYFNYRLGVKEKIPSGIRQILETKRP
ncbi:acyl-CoA thioesterase [Leptospira sp. 96542]|nr:acyl-CoA thioesterase [Leptospira sp. 96542]